MTINEVIEAYYQGVIDRINFVPGDDEFKVKVRKELEEMVEKKLVLSIWKHISDEQAKHFEDFAVKEIKISPTKPQNEILAEFAAMYEDLWKKSLADIDEFVEEFVAEMNR